MRAASEVGNLAILKTEVARTDLFALCRTLDDDAVKVPGDVAGEVKLRIPPPCGDIRPRS
jgi:hypothetical protein